MNLKSYLKLLFNIDYPNQSESISNISKAVDYTPYLFNQDLLNTLGVVGLTDFVGKTFSKMGAMVCMDVDCYFSASGNFDGFFE